MSVIGEEGERVFALGNGNSEGETECAFGEEVERWIGEEVEKWIGEEVERWIGEG